MELQKSKKREVIIILLVISVLILFTCIYKYSFNRNDEFRIEFYRRNISTNLDRKLCSIKDTNVKKIKAKVVELNLSKSDCITCFGDLRPSFGGGIDFAIIYKNGLRYLEIKGKAPYSSYMDDSYPDKDGYFQDFRENDGQLMHNGKLIVNLKNGIEVF